jgi:hypothetical protein
MRREGWIILQPIRPAAYEDSKYLKCTAASQKMEGIPNE